MSSITIKSTSLSKNISNSIPTYAATDSEFSVHENEISYALNSPPPPSPPALANGYSITHNATRLGVGGGFGRSERSEHSEGCRQVFERVRLRSPAGHIEQLTQQQHRGVRLTAAAGA